MTTSNAASIAVLEPATETVLETVPRADRAAVDEAVERAQIALPAWRRLDPAARALALRRLVAVMEAAAEDLSVLEARNVGKPLAAARGEIKMAIETFRYFSAAPERPFGETIPVYGGLAFTIREPLGVVGLITPWNFPLAIASWKLAPALAAGNTVILKPAELTPLTAIRLAELALEAGLPEYVFQVVVGSGVECGARLVEHPDVAKIAFTGSTAVGRTIAATAAHTLKRVTLELGGKSANVVFADADLSAAAAAAPGAFLDNAGQDCCARSRILVERPALEGFLDLLREPIERLVVGPPLEPASEMGPLISAQHRDTVAAFIDDDATIAIQGTVPEGPGYWFAPTVLYPLPAAHAAAVEEIFGPIAVVVPFDSEPEAIALANDSIYGLSGSVWTRDGAKALRVVRGIESGNLSINSNSSVRVQTPFGGFKQSGYGRELGPHATDAYSEVKTVFYRTESDA
jgi:acyl-CoA reductase-like NAD-dependent aldehyde dehydrogenase